MPCPPSLFHRLMNLLSLTEPGRESDERGGTGGEVLRWAKKAVVLP